MNTLPEIQTEYRTLNNLLYQSYLPAIINAAVEAGIFASHHISDDYGDEMQVTMKIIELMTKAMKYPAHELPATTLKNVLAKTGFSEFDVNGPDQKLPFPTTLVTAKKITEI